MKRLTIVLSLFIMPLITGCAYAPSQTGTALYSVTSEPWLATSNNVATKEGRACGSNVLGIFSSGDYSINKAKEHGNIKSVVTVDKQVKNVLFVYSKVCTIVRGY